jgi:hypothetical protein
MARVDQALFDQMAVFPVQSGAALPATGAAAGTGWLWGERDFHDLPKNTASKQ